MKGCGVIEVEDHLDDRRPGSRITRDLLNSFCRAFARSSKAFYDVSNDLPFVYRERQLGGFVAGALGDAADAVFPELPIGRDRRGADGHGWTDFWVAYRKSTFLIELKHNYELLSSSKPASAALHRKWRGARVQLNNLSIETLRNKRYFTGPILKVALLMVTHWCRQPPYDIDDLPAQLRKRHQEMSTDLSRNLGRVTWSALYRLHRSMQVEFDTDSGPEWYPAVSLFVNTRSYH